MASAWGCATDVRRAVLCAVGCALLAGFSPHLAGAAPSATSARLPAWSPGCLDIHQIATGRGNSALIIAPDGTSILIDAGEATGGADLITPPRPDPSRRPGEWIARYARRQLLATGNGQIDYFIATHLHPDHVGSVGAANPPSSRHDSFVLSGVTDVAELLPIGTVIDRGFPDYRYPSRLTAPFAANYIAFIEARRQQGLPCEQVRVGSADQIRLRTGTGAPAFQVRFIASNGEVWRGQGTLTGTAVPPLSQLTPADYPDENMCSIAMRVSYGRFDFYTGGDLHCDTRFGDQPWRDVETPAAKATGAVEVAVTNHHAYFDAIGAESVRALQPRVWIVPAWHLTHLNIGALERMLSERLYPGPRDIFVTDLLPATALIDERFIQKVQSLSGHVVVRVRPGGEEFSVFITESKDEADTIKATYGPYPAK